VSAEIRVVSGARAGTVLSVWRDVVIGRRADADLRFDPDRDLDVSARHAAIVRDGERWLLRDLDSRNGTFVNGRRVREAELHDGDRIMFGGSGPEIEFRMAPPGAVGQRQQRRPEVARTRGTRIGEILAENARLRLIAGGLAISLVLAVSAAIIISRNQRTDWERERAAVLARTDSLLAAGDVAVQELAGEREELAALLRSSQTDVRRLRDRLESSAPDEDTSELPDLRRQLQAATAALERQQLAASLDVAMIERTSRSAIAVIWVESADGQVFTGTAFAIRPDATLVTARHLIESDAGPPRRIGIQFSDSDQVWPARILASAARADVAIVKVDNILGDVPVVRGLNANADTLQSGLPVAWIGYPLGGETWPQDERTRRLARPLISVGVITRTTADRTEFQGYGAAGASGSPIFDAAGDVIAVVSGGESQGRVRVVYGVPVSEVTSLLDRLR
jgi:S1-C subfamily serine protease